jgi:hypothetical protein
MPRIEWSQREVVSLLLELGRQLQTLDETLGDYEADYVRKAELHNVAYNQAFLKERQNDSPQYVCKVVAESECTELKLAMDLAQTLVRAQKRKIEILRERIGVGRTAASSLRAELELERTPNQRRY